MVSALNQSLVEASYGKWAQPEADLTQMRTGYDQMCPPPKAEVEAVRCEIGGVSGLYIVPRDPKPGIILYLHGGGYVMGSSSSHFSMAAELTAAAQRALFLVDYRLAPEAPFPAALDDSCSVYRALLAQGSAPQQIALVGDSAGGGLALSTVLTLRDLGLAAPACVGTISAWADLSCSAESLVRNAGIDPILTADVPLQYAELYLGDHPPTDPKASALFGDFGGFPPLFMQVGSDEILLDDSLRVAARARQAGCDVEIEIADGMMHVFQMLTWLIPEARSALLRMAAFVAQKLDEATI
ncbi:alpha/beta hydrolase [Sphingomonas sp. SRS2]|uniref:alpha/beta hydrolase n=1 Tax=Sphingomonas sp. SRS2 TaxID=133190 RepID=UPI0006183F6E|nr:alpha/beta hydrolase [Sphingomonas sp. SRS2]KKC26119.1 hypothetical protein WP12_10895 [Sphingomonas sp. SRS2]